MTPKGKVMVDVVMCGDEKPEPTYMTCQGCQARFRVMAEGSKATAIIGYCPFCGEKVERVLFVYGGGPGSGTDYNWELGVPHYFSGGGGGIGPPKDVTTYQVPKDRSDD